VNDSQIRVDDFWVFEENDPICSFLKKQQFLKTKQDGL